MSLDLGSSEGVNIVWSSCIVEDDTVMIILQVWESEKVLIWRLLNQIIA